MFPHIHRNVPGSDSLDHVHDHHVHFVKFRNSGGIVFGFTLNICKSESLAKSDLNGRRAHVRVNSMIQLEIAVDDFKNISRDNLG